MGLCSRGNTQLLGLFVHCRPARCSPHKLSPPVGQRAGQGVSPALTFSCPFWLNMRSFTNLHDTWLLQLPCKSFTDCLWGVSHLVLSLPNMHLVYSFPWLTSIAPQKWSFISRAWMHNTVFFLNDFIQSLSNTRLCHQAPETFHDSHGKLMNIGQISFVFLCLYKSS